MFDCVVDCLRPSRKAVCGVDGGFLKPSPRYTASSVEDEHACVGDTALARKLLVGDDARTD